MPGENINVFVSYSHADASLVAPVVKLLQVNKSLVFQDIDSIAPGKRWRSEIARGLEQSHLVVVFWCQHASHSDEVAKEWQAAIAQNKDLLPLLLDATPLPGPLGEFQWIDFRGTVGPNHAAVGNPAAINPAPAPAPGPPPARASFRSGRWLSLAAVAAVFALAGILSVHVGQQASHPDVPPSVTMPKDDPATKPPVEPKKPQPAQHNAAPDLGVLLALTALLVVLAGRHARNTGCRRTEHRQQTRSRNIASWRITA
jgi:TIR domain